MHGVHGTPRPAERDLNPRRYVWRKSGEAILDKIRRARQALEACQ